MLRRALTHIEILKVEDPGTVIYEDGWEIVPKPHLNDRIRG